MKLGKYPSRTRFKPTSMTFRIPIYGFKVMFRIDSDTARMVESLPKDIGDFLKKKYKGDYSSGGMFACVNDVYVMLITVPISDSIAHEIDHVCRLVMYNIGHRPRSAIDEPTAYLKGWMSQYIEDRLEPETA